MKTKAEKGWPPLVTEEDELKRKLEVARETLTGALKWLPTLDSPCCREQADARRTVLAVYEALEEIGSRVTDPGGDSHKNSDVTDHRASSVTPVGQGQGLSCASSPESDTPSAAPAASRGNALSPPVGGLPGGEALEEMGSGDRNSTPSVQTTRPDDDLVSLCSQRASGAQPDPTVPSESVGSKSFVVSGGADFILHGEINMHHCLTCGIGHPINQPCKPLAESVRETVAAMSSAVAELPDARGADFEVEAARELAECVYRVDASLGSTSAGEWLCSEALTFACDALESARAEIAKLKKTKNDFAVIANHNHDYCQRLKEELVEERKLRQQIVERETAHMEDRAERAEKERDALDAEIEELKSTVHLMDHGKYGRLYYKERVEKTEQELVEARNQIALWDDAWAFGSERERAIKAERDALKKELEEVKHANEKICTGGCGGVVGHGHTYCVDCQEGADVLHAIHRKQRDEAVAALPCSSGRDENRAAKMLGKSMRYQVDKYKSIAVIEYSVAKKALISAYAEANTLRREGDESRAEVARLRSLLDRIREVDNKDVESLLSKHDALKAAVAIHQEQWKQLWAAFEPVRDWYDADGERSNIVAMVEDAVADLQQDRAECLRLKAEVKLLRQRLHEHDPDAPEIAEEAARATLNPEKPEDENV